MYPSTCQKGWKKINVKFWLLGGWARMQMTRGLARFNLYLPSAGRQLKQANWPLTWLSRSYGEDNCRQLGGKRKRFRVPHLSSVTSFLGETHNYLNLTETRVICILASTSVNYAACSCESFKNRSWRQYVGLQPQTKFLCEHCYGRNSRIDYDAASLPFATMSSVETYWSITFEADAAQVGWGVKMSNLMPASSSTVFVQCLECLLKYMCELREVALSVLRISSVRAR